MSLLLVATQEITSGLYWWTIRSIWGDAAVTTGPRRDARVGVVPSWAGDGEASEDGDDSDDGDDEEYWSNALTALASTVDRLPTLLED